MDKIIRSLLKNILINKYAIISKMERVYANRVVWSNFRMLRMVEFKYSIFICGILECDIYSRLSYYNVNKKFYYDDSNWIIIYSKQFSWKLHRNGLSWESKIIWIYNNFIQRLFYKFNAICILFKRRQSITNIFKWWINNKSNYRLIMVSISLYIF